MLTALQGWPQLPSNIFGTLQTDIQWDYVVGDDFFIDLVDINVLYILWTLIFIYLNVYNTLWYWYFLWYTWIRLACLDLLIRSYFVQILKFCSWIRAIKWFKNFKIRTWKAFKVLFKYAKCLRMSWIIYDNFMNQIWGLSFLAVAEGRLQCIGDINLAILGTIMM